jgi:hypothetical protein
MGCYWACVLLTKCKRFRLKKKILYPRVLGCSYNKQLVYIFLSLFFERKAQDSAYFIEKEGVTAG